MPDNVCQRFLNDTINGRFDLSGESISLINPQALESGSNSRTFTGVLNQAGERLDQPHMVKTGWPQIHCKAMKTFQYLICQNFQLRYLLGNRRLDVGGPLN